MMPAQPPGRNDPCPCGSGLKFKRCHGQAQPPPKEQQWHPAILEQSRKMDAWRVELDAARALAGASKGAILLGELKNLETTAEIFSRNSRQLLKTLVDFGRIEVGMPLWDAEKPELIADFNIEVSRLVHNFLAASATLADHERALVNRKFGGPDFDTDYRARVKETFDTPTLPRFVKSLRNFFLHSEVVPMHSKMEISWRAGEKTKFDGSVRLNIEQARRWSGWQGPALEHLNSFSEDPQLKDIFASYTGIVLQFYDWFGERIRASRSDDLQELQALGEAYNRVLDRKPLPLGPAPTR